MVPGASPVIPASNTPVLESDPASARLKVTRFGSVPYLKYTIALGFIPRSVSAPFRVADMPVTPVGVTVETVSSEIGPGSAMNDRIAPQTSPVEPVAQAWK